MAHHNQYYIVKGSPTAAGQHTEEDALEAAAAAEESRKREASHNAALDLHFPHVAYGVLKTTPGRRSTKSALTMHIPNTTYRASPSNRSRVNFNDEDVEKTGLKCAPGHQPNYNGETPFGQYGHTHTVTQNTIEPSEIEDLIANGYLYDEPSKTYYKILPGSKVCQTNSPNIYLTWNEANGKYCCNAARDSDEQIMNHSKDNIQRMLESITIDRSSVDGLGFAIDTYLEYYNKVHPDNYDDEKTKMTKLKYVFFTELTKREPYDKSVRGERPHHLTSTQANELWGIPPPSNKKQKSSGGRTRKQSKKTKKTKKTMKTKRSRSSRRR